MLVDPQTKRLLKSAVRGWKRVGVLPCEAHVFDRGVPGCTRWVVQVSFASFDAQASMYVGEYDTKRIAERAARSCNDLMHREFDKPL